MRFADQVLKAYEAIGFYPARTFLGVRPSKALECCGMSAFALSRNPKLAMDIVKIDRDFARSYRHDVIDECEKIFRNTMAFEGFQAGFDGRELCQCTLQHDIAFQRWFEIGAASYSTVTNLLGR